MPGHQNVRTAGRTFHRGFSERSQSMRAIRLTVLASLVWVALAALIGTASAQEDAADFRASRSGSSSGLAPAAATTWSRASSGLRSPNSWAKRSWWRTGRARRGESGGGSTPQSQPADGYTLVVGAIGQLAIAQAIYPNLPFHPTKTLVPLHAARFVLAGHCRLDAARHPFAEGPRRLRQGEPGQVELSVLLAGLHHPGRVVQAQDRHAGATDPL